MGNYKAKLNPFTGQLQLVNNDGALFHVKDPVATHDDLPITGNGQHDLRAVEDTDTLWIWSILVPDGTLSDWKSIGGTSSVLWSNVINRPSSAVADIDSAVNKMHTQNTDTALGTDKVVLTTDLLSVKQDIALKLGDEAYFSSGGDFSILGYNAYLKNGSWVIPDSLKTSQVMAMYGNGTTTFYKTQTPGGVDFIQIYNIGTTGDFSVEQNLRVLLNTYLGNGTDSDIYIFANNADTHKPFLVYNHTTSTWQYSNDGVSAVDFGGSDINIPVTKVIYVDINRIDSYTETGSIAKPYKTIPNALAAITNNDTSHRYVLKIANGVYTDSFSLKPYVFIDGESKEGVIINTSIVQPGVGGLVEISNLTLLGEINYSAEQSGWSFNFHDLILDGGQIFLHGLTDTISNGYVIFDNIECRNSYSFSFVGYSSLSFNHITNPGDIAIYSQPITCYITNSILSAPIHQYATSTFGYGVLNLYAYNNIAIGATWDCNADGILYIDNQSIYGATVSGTGTIVHIEPSGLVGTKQVDETDIGDGKALVYNISEDKLVYTDLTGGGGANTSLSNLTTTSINKSLIPGIDITYDLGTASKRWRDLYLNSGSIKDGTHTVTVPDIADAISKKHSNSLDHSQNTDTGTNQVSFAIGAGTDVDIIITAQNNDTNKPKLRYNHTTNKWEFSNDGTNYIYMGGSGGSPAGSDKQVQFNDSDSFGADAGLTYDKISKTLGITGTVKGVLNLGSDSNGLARIYRAQLGRTFAVQNRVNTWGDVYTPYAIQFGRAPVGYGVATVPINTNEGTFEVWVNFGASWEAIDFADSIIDCKVNGTNFIGLYRLPDGGDDGRPCITGFYDGQLYTYQVKWTIPEGITGWHQVQFTWSVANSRLELYIDENLEHGLNQVLTPISGVINAIYIGFSTAYSYQSRVALDELRIFNYPISSDKVSIDYNAGDGQKGVDESGLLAGYHFDDGTGAQAVDYSHYHRTMDFIGNYSWIAGWVGSNLSTVMASLITSEDLPNIKDVEGLHTFGHEKGYTQIDGQRIILNGSIIKGTRNITASESALETDNIILADDTTGEITVTLPKANIDIIGKEIKLYKINDSAYNMQFDVVGGDTLLLSGFISDRGSSTTATCIAENIWTRG